MSKQYSDAVLNAIKTWLPSFYSPVFKQRSPTEVLADLESRYHLTGTINAVRKRGVQRVALQFPDSLLGEAPLVCAVLDSMTLEQSNESPNNTRRVRYFILGDTSYGECCVDEVAAAHLDGELVVHYGDCCLSHTRELPVLYVVNEKMLETKAMLQKIEEVRTESNRKSVLVLWGVQYWRTMKNVREAIVKSSDDHVEVAKLRVDPNRVIEPLGDNINNRKDDENTLRGSGVGPLIFQDKVLNEKLAILWVGRESSAMRNAALKFRSYPIYSWTGNAIDKVEKANYKRVLGKRYYLIEKVKDAQRIGIVAGTLGVSGNLEIIERCKRIIENAGRKWYMLVVGKITPTKLANFAEMDAFVLVACPQNSLIDSNDFFKPILTPLELDAAIGDGDVYSNQYSADFTDLLKKFERSDLRQEKAENGSSEERSIALRPGMSVSIPGQGGAADFFRLRQWQGLDYSGKEKGMPLESLPTRAERGRSGVASGYRGEKT